MSYPSEEAATRDERERLVRSLQGRGITSRQVLDALRTVPRHLFVQERQYQNAYRDEALAIEHGQTISQPLIVGEMTQALTPRDDETVLEIGTGSGYQTAVLCELFRHVYSVERDADLSRMADQRLKRLGYTNYSLKVGDGTLGWPAHAPYRAIIVTAGGPDIPVPLLNQLSNDGARLVIPVGEAQDQELIRLVTHPTGLERRSLGKVAFVPLVGEFGWPES